jgi:hypothetical protein
MVNTGFLQNSIQGTNGIMGCGRNALGMLLG